MSKRAYTCPSCVGERRGRGEERRCQRSSLPACLPRQGLSGLEIPFRATRVPKTYDKPNYFPLFLQTPYLVLIAPVYPPTHATIEVQCIPFFSFGCFFFFIVLNDGTPLTPNRRGKKKRHFSLDDSLVVHPAHGWGFFIP